MPLTAINAKKNQKGPDQKCYCSILIIVGINCSGCNSIKREEGKLFLKEGGIQWDRSVSTTHFLTNESLFTSKYELEDGV